MQVRREGPSDAREAVEQTERLPVTNQARMPCGSRKQQRTQVRTQPPQGPSRQFGRCLSAGITLHQLPRPAFSHLEAESPCCMTAIDKQSFRLCVSFQCSISVLVVRRTQTDRAGILTRR